MQTTADYRHSIRFFQALDRYGWTELAASTAAVDGRVRLAALFHKRNGMSAKSAWKMARSQVRAAASGRAL